MLLLLVLFVVLLILLLLMLFCPPDCAFAGACFVVLLIVLLLVLLCTPDSALAGAFCCVPDCASPGVCFCVGVWPRWAKQQIPKFLVFLSRCLARLCQAAGFQFSGLPVAGRLPGTTSLVRKCGLTDESASGQL